MCSFRARGDWSEHERSVWRSMMRSGVLLDTSRVRYQISSWTLENKFYITARPCFILYLSELFPIVQEPIWLHQLKKKLKGNTKRWSINQSVAKNYQCCVYTWALYQGTHQKRLTAQQTINQFIYSSLFLEQYLGAPLLERARTLQDCGGF